MPWKRWFPEDQRVQFVVEATYGDDSIADLCRAFGISRKTGFKWLARYEQEGAAGLIDRPRAPHSHPNALAEDVVEHLVAMRRNHPTWGPRKILATIRAREPELELPAASTVGDLLKRVHLVRARRHRPRTPPMTAPFGACGAPNDVWCADFKGWFRVGDGSRCDPFTLTDAYSRYLLRCDAVASTGEAAVRASLESAFKEFGLPKAIRSDNGPPFATKGAGGLSRLSVWLIHLGITPERIEPGHPEQNGRHERMHRTLKEETALPPRHTVRAQQLAFDRFRHQYNEERPHEALGQKPPASVYEPSLRRMPPFLPELEYPPDVELRSVRSSGEIKWQNRLVYIGEALAHEIVSVQMIAYLTHVVCLGPIELGRIKDDALHLGLIRPRRTRRR